MLKVENLNLTIGSFKLENINFNLPKGYIMLLAGANASGKSTLIKTILDIYTKNSGLVFVDDMDLDEENIKVKEIIGTVLDEKFFIDNATVKENVKILGKYFSKFDYNLFDTYTKRFDLNTKLKLKQLSKGNYIKFNLAFALSHGAKLFIMDEPFASLDAHFSKELYNIMTDIISDGEKSILVSTHLIEDIEYITDYVGILDNGSMRYFGSKEEFLDMYSIITCENYKSHVIPAEQIVYKQENETNTRILIKNKRYQKLSDNTLVKERPNLDELICYLMRGGKEYVKNIYK